MFQLWCDSRLVQQKFCIMFVSHKLCLKNHAKIPQCHTVFEISALLIDTGFPPFLYSEPPVCQCITVAPGVFYEIPVFLSVRYILNPFPNCDLPVILPWTVLRGRLLRIPCRACITLALSITPGRFLFQPFATQSDLLVTYPVPICWCGYYSSHPRVQKIFGERLQ